MVVPACAGVIPYAPTANSDSFRGPRVCGGDPDVPDWGKPVIKWSPRVRG